MRNGTRSGDAKLLSRAATVKQKTQKSPRLSRQRRGAPAIPPRPPTSAGDPAIDLVSATFILDELIEEARELPFNQALAQFDGLAGLLSGNADLRACREALLKIKAGTRALDQLRVEFERLRR